MNSRDFDLEDQYLFAKVSGDNNPLHIDSDIARRMLFGGPVVHGIHLLLWSLDTVLIGCEERLQFVSISASFNKPIGLNENVSINHSWISNDKIKINLTSNKVIKTFIDVEWRRAEPFGKNKFNLKYPKAVRPKLLKKEEIINKTGRIDLCISEDETNEMFPNLVRCLHTKQIASLLAMSKLVGTECPGLNSVFSGLDLLICESKKNNHLEYRVVDFDERVNMVGIHVDSAMLCGTIKTFIRPELINQESYIFHKEIVTRGEFADQYALVLGGSRGLGEVTCKLLVAGNAKVVATYANGDDDVKRIKNEIELNGGNIKFIRCDVLDKSQFMMHEMIKNVNFTHLYYFPTPFIFSGEGGVFLKEIFYEFCDFYVSEFFEFVDHFASKTLTRVLYPSSIAVEETPLNMAEYIAAKSAGEALCAILEKKYPDLIIYKPRLPRMATDQTVSILPVNSEHPSYVMLDHLRRIKVNHE